MHPGPSSNTLARWNRARATHEEPERDASGLPEAGVPALEDLRRVPAPGLTGFRCALSMRREARLQPGASLPRPVRGHGPGPRRSRRHASRSRREVETAPCAFGRRVPVLPRSGRPWRSWQCGEEAHQSGRQAGFVAHLVRWGVPLRASSSPPVLKTGEEERMDANAARPSSVAMVAAPAIIGEGRSRPPRSHRARDRPDRSRGRGRARFERARGPLAGQPCVRGEDAL